MKKTQTIYLSLLSLPLVLMSLTSCNPHKHVYEGEVTAPTCVDAGYTTYTCECGDTYVADEVPELGHDEIFHEGQEATCTENGWEAYVTCSRCEYTTYKAIETQGHQYEEEVTLPTCTERGYTTFTCACGDSYIGNYVDANGHDEVNHEGKPATCTEDGWEAYVTCNDCEYTTFKALPATGHTYTDYVCVCGSKTVDFNSIAITHSSGGDSAYTKTWTTAAGWVLKYCAIQAGGTTVINPNYPVVGPTKDHKAACLVGKTSTPGQITSPTLTGGLSEIHIRYTKMFTDTKLAYTITVTDLTTSSTYTHSVSVEKESQEKYVVYNDDWKLETPVSGNYTIDIINDCPSNLNSNKDRVTILSIEYK
jgi:hypothetical protein